MIRAPCATAYVMPSAMACGSLRLIEASDDSGSLNSRVTRTERILAAGAMPTMPDRSPAPCPCPAMMAATAVPEKPQKGLPGVRPEPV